MATKLSNLYQSGAQASAYPALAGAVVTQRSSFAVAAAGANALALNDLVDMLPIPPGLVPVHVRLVSDDLDSNGAPTMTFDVGILSGTPGDATNARTIGAEFFSGSTLPQAGGVAFPTLKTAHRVTASNVERSIGIKVATAAATLQAGVIDVIVDFAAA